MEEKAPTQENQPPVEIVKNIFETNFDGSFEEIKRKDVPEKALKHFEGHSSLFIHPDDYKENNFSSYYRIERKDGIVTYVASQIKVYKDSAVGKLHREVNVYFYDMLGDEKLGHGEVRFYLDHKKGFMWADRPFVGFTQTEGHYSEYDREINPDKKSFTQSGFGKKRILLMGAYTKSVMGKDLYSGDTNSFSVKVWESLEKEGLAKEVKLRDDYPRRTFKLTYRQGK